MPQTVIRVVELPDNALDAAARFHAEWVPQVRDVLQGSGPAADIDAIAIVFPPAGHQHRGWRLAAVQELAREAAPRRVNGVAGAREDAIDQATDWLASAPGVTGQLIEVSGR